jgi:nitrogen-specific signal transduction histidine kinase
MTSTTCSRRSWARSTCSSAKGLGGEREQRLIAGALQSADRAKTLVQRCSPSRAASRCSRRRSTLEALVADMAELVDSTSGPQVRVVVDAPAGLPTALADPNQLEMAILNLR